MVRQMILLATLLLASTAAAQPVTPSLTGQAARKTTQETFKAMEQKLEPEVGLQLRDAWQDVDSYFRQYQGSSAATLAGSRVDAALKDAELRGETHNATRGLSWDWRTGRGQVRIEHKHDISTSLQVARIRPGSQFLVKRTQQDGAGLSLEAVRVTRRPGQVSLTLARKLAAWRLPWQRKGLVKELPRQVRRALARPGARFTIVTYHTRTSLQPQPSLSRSSRPPADVGRRVSHRIVVGNLNAPLSAACARELRAR